MHDPTVNSKHKLGGMGKTIMSEPLKTKKPQLRRRLENERNLRTKSTGGKIVERYVAVYPGTKTAGVCLAVVENRELTRVAVGSIPMPTILSTVEQFKTDLVIVEPFRDATTHAEPFHIPERARLIHVSPKWNQDSLSLPPWRRHAGPLGQNAWRMMFKFIVDRDYAIGPVKPVRYTRLWLRENNGTRQSNH